MPVMQHWVAQPLAIVAALPPPRPGVQAATINVAHVAIQHVCDVHSCVASPQTHSRCRFPARTCTPRLASSWKLCNPYGLKQHPGIFVRYYEGSFAVTIGNYEILSSASFLFQKAPLVLMYITLALFGPFQNIVPCFLPSSPCLPFTRLSTLFTGHVYPLPSPSLI